MATLPWKFLINTFYSRTFDSMKNALSLTNDHLSKLTANESDPDILGIKTAYLPVHNAFITAYNQLDSKLGIYRGQTQTFEELLTELGRTKINEWRGKVFAVFPEGTPNARAIFPRNREPFQSDTYDQRVEAVKALSLTLATYTGQPALITLGAEVDAYYIVLNGARALQQTDEGSVNILRSNLRDAHVLLCNGLYKNLGLLMAKYYTNPQRVADYYDLTLLRNTGEEEPVVLNGSINANTVINVNALAPDLQPAENSILRLRNTSDNPLTITFYAAGAPNDFPGPGPQFSVSSGETVEVPIADFNFDTYNNFNIYNPNGIAAAWEIEVTA